MNLEQTKSYFDRFICEALTSSPENQAETQGFLCSIRGNRLEEYFKKRAWKDDLDGETRVYIIREPGTRQIVLFFSIRCSLAFTTYPMDDEYKNLSSAESDYVNMLVMLLQEGALEDYYKNVEGGKAFYSSDRLALLLKIVEHRRTIKNEVNAAKDSRNVMNVFESYSAIEIRHFCRDDRFKVPDEIRYPVGFGLFRQKIIPIIEEVSKKIGCEYLYLFAADRSDNGEDQKLISYYKEALCFYDLEDEGVVILKPDYDFHCKGLLQKISQLSFSRDYAWEAFSDNVSELNRR
ncbi:MAG: hypothetical protein IJ646_06170 [Clostridia bacterium]|nr:hypothetical protein [Clostridia bacterium]